MASREREYIDKGRKRFKSPIELQKEVDARYGADAEQKMSYREARDVYQEAILWSSWNDIAMQDHWAEECESGIHRWDEDNPKPYVKKVLSTLKTTAEHLIHGQQLGLSDLEQRVVDTLWGWVPHNYQDNYVACAREVSKEIIRLLPPDSEEKSKEGYEAYYLQVINEVKRLAAQYDVDFDTSEYNLTIGYFYEWMSNEYGLVSKDILDEED